MSDLTVTLSANVSEFKRGMADAQKQMKDSVSKMKEGWGDLTHTLKQVTVALTAVSGAVLAIVKTTANAGDAFQKLSIRTGASTEFLSEMAHAAELSDVSLGDMEVAFRKLAMTMGDANQGLATAKDAFDALGIEVNNTTENRLKTMEEIFPELVDAFDKIEDSTLKASLAVEIFGRSGTALIPLLAEGKDGIAAMRDEAKALGLTWSKDATDAAAKFNDDLTRMQNGLKGIRNEIGQALFPVLNEWIITGTDKIKLFIANDLPGHIQKLKEVLPEVAAKIKEFAVGVGEVVKWIFDHGDLVKVLLEIALAIKAIGLVLSTYKIAAGLVGMAQAFGTASKAVLAFMSGPAGLITLGVVSAIAGIALAFKNLKTDIDYCYGPLDGVPPKFDAIGQSAFNNTIKIDDFKNALIKMGETDIANKLIAGIQLTEAELAILQESLRKTGYQIEQIGNSSGLQIVSPTAKSAPKKAESTPYTSFRTDIMTDWTKESIAAMQTWQTSSAMSLNQMADSYTTFEDRYKDNMSAIIDNTLVASQTLSTSFALDTSLFEESISGIPPIIESVTLQGTELWSNALQQWADENQLFVQGFSEAMNQVANISGMISDYQINEANRVARNKTNKANETAANQIKAIERAVKAGVISEKSGAAQIYTINSTLNDNLKAIQKEQEDEANAIRRRQKPLLIAQAVANTAAAILNVAAAWPPKPFGITATQMGLMAAAGAVQVGTIAAQKFATGGIVLPKIKSSGTDTVPAMLTPGEAVVRNSVVNNYGVDAVNRFATKGDTSGLGGSNVYITINTTDTESMDRYLRGEGRQPMIDFYNREIRMRTI